MADNDRLIRAIDLAEDNSISSEDDSDLAEQRSLSLDAYAGVNIEPAGDGRSQVVDWTVFETIQWILPSLTRIFANGDSIVEFVAFDEKDEPGAEQESDALNYHITKKTNWFMTCLTWFQDALLTKNAYCYAFMEEKLRTETETYKGQSIEAVQILLDEEGVELIAQDEYVDPDDEPKLIDPTSGQEIPPEMQEQAMQAFQQQGMTLEQAQGLIQPPRSLFDIEIRKTTPSKKLNLMVLPPERVKIDGNTPDFTTADADYFEYFEHVTISELRSRGLDIPDDTESDIDTDTLEDDSRDKFLGNMTDDDLSAADPSMRIVKARTIWIRFDEDEDGIAELQKVIRVGNEIHAQEPASRIPVASIVPFINTHRHMGNSVSDLVFDIGRIKTAILRGGLDSLNFSTRPQHAASNKVNLDDLLTKRPGSVVQVNTDQPDVPGHIMVLPTEFVFPQSQMGLQHMDTVTEARVGVNRIFAGIDDAANNDHNRIGQLNSMAAQRVEQIARIFANGVEYLFSIVHEILIKSGHSSETIKLRGQWVTIDPAGWRTGRDMTMVAPFSAGNKDSLLQRLMLVKGAQMEAAQFAPRVVSEDNAYNMGLELAKAADIPGNKFFTDPASVPPPQPPPDYTAEALKIEAEKVEASKADSQIDAQVKVKEIDSDEKVRLRIAELQSETQIALAQLKEGKDVNLEQLRANLKNAPIELGNQQIQATGEAMSLLNQQVAASMQQLSEAVADLRDAADAPKELVFDKKGKVTGVKSNGKVRNVQRNESGRVTGI